MDTKEYSYELIIETRQNVQSTNANITFLTSGLNTDLKCTPKSKLVGVKSVEITSVLLPPSIDNIVITNANNNLTVNDGKTDLKISIPIGLIGATTLASKLQLLLNTDSTGWTVIYDFDNSKYTINKTGDNFIIYNSTINTTLGFDTSDVGPVATYTAPNKTNIYIIPYCFIMSDKLLSYKKLKPIYNDQYMNVLNKIPIVNMDTKIKFMSLISTKITFPTRPSLTDFDIRLTSPNGDLLDLNGFNWSFTIRFYF
jgi:hypothetical protein